MKRLLATAPAALVVALTLAGAAGRAAPPASADVASAAASAPASPSASASPPKALPVVHGSDIPPVVSLAPSAGEWKAGKAVLPTRGSPRDCKLTLVREWLSVRCPLVLAAGLVAGDAKGVSVQVVGRLFGETGGPGDLATTVVVPIQRGQARIISFNDPIEEYDSTALGEGPVLGVVWRDGRADPVLAMYGPPKHD